MLRERPPYLPELFRDRLFVRAVAVYEGLTGRDHRRFLWPGYLDATTVDASLEVFTTDVVGTGRFSELLEAARKISVPSRPAPVNLYAWTPSIDSRVSRQFWIDGDHGLVLSQSYPEIGNSAAVSFSIIGNPQAVSRRCGRFGNGNLNPDYLKAKDLLICQLQGRTYYGQGAVLSEFHWERLLVGLVAEWAYQVGFPRLLLLPSEHNYWPNVQDNYRGTPFLRYDVTARRLGFQRESPSAPYVLLLSPHLSEILPTLFTEND